MTPEPTPAPAAFTWADGERESLDRPLWALDLSLANNRTGEAARALDLLAARASRAAAKIRAVDSGRPGLGVLDDFGHDLVSMARTAKATNGGNPRGVWSSGEQIAVALVLNNKKWLAQAGFSVTEAAQYVAGNNMNLPADFNGWLAAVRAEVDR